MRKSLLLVLLGVFIFSCNADMDVLEYAEKKINITLSFPDNDSDCTEGVIVSKTQSELIFEWEGTEENGPYTVHLTNEATNTTDAYESNTAELAIVLDRGVIYSWYVTGSLNSSSELWSFYNAGPGLESTIPLPATAISPVSGASISQTSTTVNLIWKAEDFDDDIIGYDLYFGELNDPPLLSSDITDSRFNDIQVTVGKTYYWKIVTKDSVGNESTSQVFNFTVG